MRNRRSTPFCLIVVVATLLTAVCFAQVPDRITGTIDSSRMVPLNGQVQRRALPQYDQGRVDSSFQLNNVKLFFVLSASQAKELKQLLEEQQNPKSPNFHKWLTQAQFGDRFGMSTNDIKKTTAWLTSQGLAVGKVANGRTWINFDGTAAQIEAAFKTEIHRYNVNGEMHFANSAPPSIPAALSGIANGFIGLDDFRPKPMTKKAVPRPRNARPGYYDASTGLADFLAPNDIATIYDLGPLYTAGIDGTGEKLAIMGQTDVYLADLTNFRSGFNLPALYSGCTANSSGVLTSCTSSSTANFQYILDPNGGGDPGVSTNDLSEADLDLEWSAATARGAQIIFFNSTNVFTSLLDTIDTSPLVAPVISISYGSCEWNLGGALLTSSGTPGQFEAAMMDAASLGITIMNSAGDSGSAECDPPIGGTDPNGLAIGGLSVSWPASSPEVTGVGGTAIEYPGGFSSTYWGTSDTTNDGGTAQNPPLPEIAWNDDVELPVAGYGGTQLSWQQSYAIVESGGGVSNCAEQNSAATLCVGGYAVPSYQTSLVFPTAPPTAGRYSPDVSLLASPNFPGYIYCTPIEELTDPSDGESTSSCGSGGTAGITTAVNGSPVGGNPYTINPSIVGGTSASSPVFAGIITMLNQFLNGADSTGLGAINATLYKLAATPANGAFHQVTSGNNMVYCSGDTPSVASSTDAYFSSMTEYQCPGSTGATELFGWQADNADSTTGYNLVTGLGSIDANNLFTAWQASLGSFTISPTPASLSVIAGQTSPATTITFTPTGSFSSTVTFSCTNAPAGVTCNFSPATATTSSPTSSLTVVTPPYLATGAVPITVSASGGGVTETTTVTLNVSATNQSFTLTVGTSSLQVTAGTAGTATITVTPANSFNSPLTFTCSDPSVTATGAQACTVTPSTPTSAASVTVNIPTAAASAQLRPPASGRGIFYAALLPGLLGIVFTAGSRKRSARGLRFLSLMVVLGLSTLWLGACSSNSSSTHSVGTPPGTYTATVTATTGGTNPVTFSLPITLTVTQ